MGAVAMAHTALAAPSPFGIVAPESGGSPIGGPLSPLFLTIALYQQQFYMTLLSAIETRRQPTHTVDPADGDVAKQIRAVTGRRGADYIFEAVGRLDVATFG